MADTVTTQIVYQSPRRLVISFTNTSDGTGESAVKKVDKSAYTGPDGTEPAKFVIDRIYYCCVGMQVRIAFDGTTDGVVAVLGGDGCIDYREFGGFKDNSDDSTPGDILFTTIGHTANDSYSIMLDLRKID